MRARFKISDSYAVLRLTHKQWLALWKALDSTLSRPELFDGVFETEREAVSARVATSHLLELGDQIRRGEQGPA
jgi:hypothetical protein